MVLNKNKFIESKYFSSIEEAIGFVGPNYTSFNIGSFSFSLFDTDLSVAEDKITLRIKMKDINGNVKKYTVYNRETKQKGDISADDLIVALLDNPNFYTPVLGNFSKIQNFKSKFAHTPLPQYFKK